MIALDTNVLVAAAVEAHEQTVAARAFLVSLSERSDVGISEFVLAELYVLLRNPMVVSKPLTARAAVAVCQGFRQHPRWQLLGFPPDSAALHSALWEAAASPAFARRRIYDLRLALALIQQGATEFATANVKDFEAFGFQRVWNPLETARS